MKPFGKLLTASLLFSLAATFPLCAAETNESLLQALGFPPKAERVIPESLQTAFSQESKDQAQYLAFADKADEEGQPEIGKVFRALANAKQGYLDHYAKGIEMLGGASPVVETGTSIVKNTAANLKSALDSELYKSKDMYAALLTQILPDDPLGVPNLFRSARKVAEAHASLFQEGSATGPSRIPVSAYNLCSVCGYSFLEWAEVETCPICGAPKEKFKKIN